MKSETSYGLENKISIHTGALFPWSLLGVKFLNRRLHQFDSDGFQYMPVKLDRTFGKVPNIHSQHTSWRGEKSLDDVKNAFSHHGISKGGLSLLTYLGIPLGDDVKGFFDASKHTVVFPDQISLFRSYGIHNLSIQPKNEGRQRIQNYIEDGIKFTLDTQHTSLNTWNMIVDSFPASIVGCHVRCGPDVADWREARDSLLANDTRSRTPLYRVETLPPEVDLVSEVTMIALGKLTFAAAAREYHIIHENIRAAARKRQVRTH